MTTQYVDSLKQIPTLNWLPWIGDDYEKTKILFIGDSHYDDKHGWLRDKNATREFVKNQGLNSDNPKYKNRRFLSQIEKIVLDKPSSSYDERIKFWTSVAYFNLVQRLLPSRKARPNHNDFDEGWETFFKIASIIKPSYCIKLGIDGVGRLGSLLSTKETNWRSDNVKEFYMKPYSINLTSQDHKMRIIFTNHPTGSRGFNSTFWTKFINEQFRNLDKLILGKE